MKASHLLIPIFIWLFIGGICVLFYKHNHHKTNNYEAHECEYKKKFRQANGKLIEIGTSHLWNTFVKINNPDSVEYYIPKPVKE